MKLHYFNPTHAEWFASVEKALIINHLLFWTKLNTENECHIHDGRVWVAATAASISKRMPYLKPSSINRWLKELVSDKILMQYSRGYDRTLWYSVITENLPQETAQDCFSPEKIVVEDIIIEDKVIGESVVLSKVEKEMPEKEMPILVNAIPKMANGVPKMANGVPILGDLSNKVLDKALDNKLPYGEFGFVLLSKKEEETFIDKHGLDFFNRCVEKLENWIGSRPDGKEKQKYLKQNHYYVLNGWVRKSIMKEIEDEKKFGKEQRTFAKVYKNAPMPRLNNQKIKLD